MGDCSAILLAAGRSRRLGFDKILTPLADRPAFRYAYDVLQQSDEITEIIIVTREDLFPAFNTLLEDAEQKVPVRLVKGGAERQDSVYAGLQAAQEAQEMALIHDAARPLITTALITSVLAVARETGAAICGRPAADTLKKTEDQKTISETLDRSQIWQVETPQVFRRELILAAYKEVVEKHIPVTDDASALEHAGHSVSLVESAELNLKITREADWKFMQWWLMRSAGEQLRHELHQANNAMTPLVGFLPFLEKYKDTEEKFSRYHQDVAKGAQQVVGHLRNAQEQVREIFKVKE